MIDDVDVANNTLEDYVEREISRVRADIPQGVAGECDLCGDWFGRLVGGACVPCRDRFNLR